MNEVQAIEKMKSAAVESMRTMPAAERELVLNRLLGDAQRSVLSTTYPALVRLHGDLLRIHNAMLANERMNAIPTTPRQVYAPPPQPAPAPQPLYSDAQFAREQQRGWLAFGMVVGGTGALVASLHAAPLVTAGLIAAGLFIKYVTIQKPPSDPPSSGPTQIHNHYHNTNNYYQK